MTRSLAGQTLRAFPYPSTDRRQPEACIRSDALDQSRGLARHASRRQVIVGLAPRLFQYQHVAHQIADAESGQPGLTCAHHRSQEHTSELQSPYVISYAVFCLKK